MPLQQGTCLGKQGVIAREWLRLEPRRALSTPFKTMNPNKQEPWLKLEISK